MGRYNQGVLGEFSGKIGPVIGSSWKDIGYMRGKPRRVKSRTVSPKIEIQRAKFALAANFVKTIKGLLSITFPEFRDQMTARNNALAKVLQQAVGGEFPDLHIEYSRVQMASGSLAAIIGAAATSNQPGAISFTWKNDTGYGNAKAEDKAILIAFCESLNSFNYIVSDAMRTAETASLNVKLFSGKEVHTWLSFLSENGKDVATSAYTGALTVA